MVWAKASTLADEQFLFERKSAGGSPLWNFRLHPTSFQALVSDGTNQAAASISSTNVDDDEWHQYVVRWDGATGTVEVFQDGVFVGSNTNGSVGSIDNGSATITVGADKALAKPADNCTIALLRIGAALPSDAHIRFMYAVERGLFEANAKCLLQSGTTDVVRDVFINPYTKKAIVTQADSQTIWDGLAVSETRTIATGGATFKHGLLFGKNDDVAEINDANLYASIAAKNLRGTMAQVERNMAEALGGVDLSKAKAFVSQTSSTSTPAIGSSFNIKSVTRTGTGLYDVEFATPFKSSVTDAITWVGFVTNNSLVGYTAGIYESASDRFTARINTENSSNANTDSAFMALFFGETEND